MQILSDECKEIAKIIDDYNKWEFVHRHRKYDEIYYVRRHFGNVELNIYGWGILASLTEECSFINFDWSDHFNIIETAYLHVLGHFLLSHKEKEYATTERIKEQEKNAKFTSNVINSIIKESK